MAKHLAVTAFVFCAMASAAFAQVLETTTVVIDKKGLVWEFDETANAINLKVEATANAKADWTATLAIVVVGKFKDAKGKIVRKVISQSSAALTGPEGMAGTMKIEGSLGGAALQAAITDIETQTGSKFQDTIDKLELVVTATNQVHSGTPVTDTETKQNPTKKPK